MVGRSLGPQPEHPHRGSSWAAVLGVERGAEEQARRQERLEGLPAWSATYLIRRHRCALADVDPTPPTRAGSTGRHRGTGRGRRRFARGGHRLVTARTGVKPWWWLSWPGAAGRSKLQVRPAGAVRRSAEAHRAGPAMAALLAAILLVGPLAASGPMASVSDAGVLPPPADPYGATGRLPELLAPGPSDPFAVGTPATPELASSGAPARSGGEVAGIPAGVLDGYRRAEANLAASTPGCRLSWTLIAAVGKVESDHARGGRIDAAGTTTSPILGPALDGTAGNAAIRDTDRGVLDRDTVWDRAVGPTQFIPTTWRAYAIDGNGDGRADPDNIHDAATATGRYLCSGEMDMTDDADLRAALFRYNRSQRYVALVLSWARLYATGATVVPDVGPGPAERSVEATLAGPVGGGGVVRPGPAIPLQASASEPASQPDPALQPVPVPRPGPDPAPRPHRVSRPDAVRAPQTAPGAAPAPIAPATSTAPQVPSNPPRSTSPPSTPSRPAPSTPPVTPPAAPSTPAPPTSPTNTDAAPQALLISRVCEELTSSVLARSFAVPAAAVSMSRTSAGCSALISGRVVLEITVTERDITTRASEVDVVQSGHGGWEARVDRGELGRVQLTVPATAGLGAARARSALDALVTHLS